MPVSDYWKFQPKPEIIGILENAFLDEKLLDLIRNDEKACMATAELFHHMKGSATEMADVVNTFFNAIVEKRIN